MLFPRFQLTLTWLDLGLCFSSFLCTQRNWVLISKAVDFLGVSVPFLKAWLDCYTKLQPAVLC